MPNRRTRLTPLNNLVAQAFQESANEELSKLVHNAVNLHRIAAPRATELDNKTEALSTKTIRDVQGREVVVIDDPLQTATQRYFSLKFQTSAPTLRLVRNAYFEKTEALPPYLWEDKDTVDAIFCAAKSALDVTQSKACDMKFLEIRTQNPSLPTAEAQVQAKKEIFSEGINRISSLDEKYRKPLLKFFEEKLINKPFDKLRAIDIQKMLFDIQRYQILSAAFAKSIRESENGLDEISFRRALETNLRPIALNIEKFDRLYTNYYVTVSRNFDAFDSLVGLPVATVYYAVKKEGESTEDFSKRTLEEIKQLEHCTSISFGLCSKELPPKKLLANLPPHIKAVTFVEVPNHERSPEWNLTPGQVKDYLSFLPPHIKTLTTSNLPVESTCFGEPETRWSELMPQLPASLENVREYRDGITLGRERRQYTLPRVNTAYESVFNTRYENNVSHLNTEAARGMYALLRHYLGTETRGPNENMFDDLYRSRRIRWRGHRAEIEDLVRKIDSNEIDDPLEILYEMKHINARNTNPNGGLQMRINFLQDHLSRNPNLLLQPDEAPSNQMTSSSAASSSS
ncbi:hypothetical protein Lgee_2183 [Legionella geestiana]|uniref:Uncharacterized protein n=1 Tax=Legionella geestiana TaxID=45065 RepID=A0A0W0TLL8_9GAMM|nr:hypothetical protein [Legionella geestiana]KTC96500.1 hypothetical protein Lgee_2183 [Legionella geestiana]QBS12541.1 hypothetical protein E4T54_07120 [Legionella geestiana]STX55012.1 Uncharacterised protein [Legionella geestiana]